MEDQRLTFRSSDYFFSLHLDWLPFFLIKLCVHKTTHPDKNIHMTYLWTQPGQKSVFICNLNLPLMLWSYCYILYCVRLSLHLDFTLISEGKFLKVTKNLRVAKSRNLISPHLIWPSVAFGTNEYYPLCLETPASFGFQENYILLIFLLHFPLGKCWISQSLFIVLSFQTLSVPRAIQ